ncbi:MAG TPA: hypothetical protein VF669_04260 [Tepidisphaeraceae bacterium]|jgi:hypothetical protein
MLSIDMVALAALLPAFIQQHLGWYLAAIILIIGLVVGLKDLGRFSGKRIWAISSVSFDESIRRRVLWITPLAILGIIIVSQLQRPLDEQDAVRQTIKICLFTTGMVVVISTIILACTNLPREIENRVIYTVVTKPTTRLEIVLGKVVGFARVSLAILLIMGVFSYGYLRLRSWNMQRYIADRLDDAGLLESERQTLAHYQQAGLLNARTLEQADDLQVYAQPPDPEGKTFTFSPNAEGSFTVPFNLSREQLTPEMTQNGAAVLVQVGYRNETGKVQPAEQPATKPATQATTVPYYGPFVMSPEERQAIMRGTKPQANPTVTIEVLDRNMNSLGTASNPLTNRALELVQANELNEVRAFIQPNVVGNMSGQPTYIRVSGAGNDVVFFTTLNPVTLIVPSAQGEAVKLAASSDRPHVESRPGSFGLQLRGRQQGRGPVGVYAYRSARVGGASDATFEARFGIERSGSEAEPGASDQDQPTQVTVRIRNSQSGAISEPVMLRPESNRPVFFTVPASAVSGGNFDVLLQCQTPGHFVGLQPSSLAMITSRQPFMLNLGLSLLILWLMSILVTAVAIFASTFLSWPIAVVLTLLILLGHWGVEQLGDATAPGIGNQIVTDLGLKKSAPAKAVSATVEQLSGLLNFVSTILPDISQFAAVEDIERGVTISARRMGEAAGVALGFGIPLTILAYIVLKNKEVAP